jgi:hypothetical protein
MSIKLSNRAFWALVALGCAAILSGRAGSQDNGSQDRHRIPSDIVYTPVELRANTVSNVGDVRARSLTIVDETGRERITLTCGKSGSDLHLVDATGKHQMHVGVMEGLRIPMSHIFMQDQEGTKESRINFESGSTFATGQLAQADGATNRGNYLSWDAAHGRSLYHVSFEPMPAN